MKLRTGIPYGTSESSSKAKLSPNISVKTTDAAPETTEWPLTYSGNGGVCNIGNQSGSICWLITVSGRIKLLLYFSSQQLINASAIAIDVFAYAFTVSSKSEFVFFVY